MSTTIGQVQDGAAANMAQAGDEPAGGLQRLVRLLGPGRILALGAVTVALLGFFAYIAFRVSEPDYTLLFAGLNLADSQHLTQRLDEMGVPYRLSPNGDAIMVPEDRALKLRMSLAEEGAPVGAAVGYELLDRAGPFGTSEFQANVNLRRAIEGELARSIGTLAQIRSARVHINLPKREAFARESSPPTASIVLGLRGGAGLDKRQVAGIKQLVAAAVPGLVPERVTLVDGNGNLLSVPGEPGTGFPMGDAADYRSGIEDRLKSKIVQLLERTVGPGRVEAEVAAEIDLDEVATTAETYDPNGQVVRSTQTTSDKSDSSEKQASNSVSVANNLPTEKAQQQDGPARAERTDRSEETINYEISRTVRNETKRPGAIKRLSIAVQVDGVYATQPDGTVSYAPRSPEEIAELSALVRGAAGLDEKRGDRLEIVARRFVQAPIEPEAEPSFLELDRADYWRIAELGTFALLTLLVLLFAVRPLLRGLMPPKTEVIEETQRIVIGVDGKPVVIPEGATPEVIAALAAGETPPALTHAAEDDAPEAMVDLRNVRGQVRASLVGDVSGVIENRTEEAVRVVRGWLHQKA